jgi:hypothetical protein
MGSNMKKFLLGAITLQLILSIIVLGIAGLFFGVYKQ